MSSKAVRSFSFGCPFQAFLDGSTSPCDDAQLCSPNVKHTLVNISRRPINQSLLELFLPLHALPERVKVSSTRFDLKVVGQGMDEGIEGARHSSDRGTSTPNQILGFPRQLLPITRGQACSGRCCVFAKGVFDDFTRIKKDSNSTASFFVSRLAAIIFSSWSNPP